MKLNWNYLFIFILSYLTITEQLNHEIKTFEQFKQIFNKKYENVHEEILKSHNFEESLKRIQMLQRTNPNVELGINEYSDLVSFYSFFLYFL